MAKLQAVLQENYAGFVTSLKLSGIDIDKGTWDANSVDQNARAGTKSLICYGESIPPKYQRSFLQVLAAGLDDEESFSTMAWIYFAYEWAGRFPPYAIIQHMVDPELFHQYCACLRKWLHIYLQGDSGDNAFLLLGTSNP